MIGFEVAGAIGVTSAQIIGFVPPALYLSYRIGKSVVRSKPKVVRGKIWSSKITLVFVYIAAYSILYLTTRMIGGPVSREATYGYTYATIIFIHAFFWYNIYYDKVYYKKSVKLVRDALRGIIFTFIVFGFLPAASAGEFEPGAFRELRDKIPFFISSLDTPLLASTAGIIAWSSIQRRWKTDVTNSTSKVLVRVFILALSLLTLVMYSRRGPMFAFILAIASSIFVRIISKMKVYYSVLSLAFVPIFWDDLAEIIIYLTQNEYASYFIAKNTAKSYETATNRIVVWSDMIDVISDVRIQHLWGYGDTSEILGFGILSHAHNTYLQLFYETGIIGLFSALFLIISTMSNLNDMVYESDSSAEILSLWSILLMLIIVSSVESLMREIFLTHLIMLIIFIVSHHVYQDKGR